MGIVPMKSLPCSLGIAFVEYDRLWRQLMLEKWIDDPNDDDFLLVFEICEFRHGNKRFPIVEPNKVPTKTAAT